MTTSKVDALQRLQRMIDEPDAYFTQARRESEAAVRSFMRERDARDARAARAARKARPSTLARALRWLRDQRPTSEGAR